MADLIDRQEAIDEILRLTHYDTVRSLYEATVANKYEDCYEDGIIDAIDVIVGLTSPQPERKTGRWTDDNACPFCGFQPWFERDIHTLSFCPNCGAAMDATENENPALSVKVVPLPTNRR